MILHGHKRDVVITTLIINNVIRTGFAIRNPEDEFDLGIGKEVSVRNAMLDINPLTFTAHNKELLEVIHSHHITLITDSHLPIPASHPTFHYYILYHRTFAGVIVEGMKPSFPYDIGYNSEMWDVKQFKKLG